MWRLGEVRPPVDFIYKDMTREEIEAQRDMYVAEVMETRKYLKSLEEQALYWNMRLYGINRKTTPAGKIIWKLLTNRRIRRRLLKF